MRTPSNQLTPITRLKLLLVHADVVEKLRLFGLLINEEGAWEAGLTDNGPFTQYFKYLENKYGTYHE